MDIKMENCNIQERESNPIIENKVESVDTTNDIDAQSAENFQKFIYDLFEKNGIINDLRAYLRGHIVNILKSAQTGDPPACQKHFTQRLELTFQALNILIVEYLLRLDFNYTLSVFVSELPLANMVFRFAKSLMHSDDGVYSGLRFQDSDVWSILNYLGVKCDSQHAANIVDMYRSDNVSPLLLCILKCVPMYSRQCGEVSSNESASTSDTLDGKAKSSHKHTMHDKCKHYLLCKTCQHRITRIKEKYSRKKKNLTKTMTETCENSMHVEDLMKNIGVMERSLIDEMFQQLKSVYETEMEMVREEDDKKVKRSLASHALQLQRRSEQMEASFKAREAQLELSVQQKKRFLWGLARALREQHRHMAAAMHQVRRETHRLELKENSLKTQLAEAEQILKQRGEDMRLQVSNELTILESHIDSMKRERDNINRERSQLENLKTVSKSHVPKIEEDEGLRSHYELLRNELSILKKYVESVKLQPKCVMERSTISDYDVTVGMVLNNAQEEKERVKSDRVKANQLVNDLKKQKNVNFSQSNLEEIYRDSSHERSRSSASSEAGDANAEPTERDTLLRLQQENDNLKQIALEQRQQIEELSSRQSSLRPRTAPAVMPLPQYFLHRVNPSASANTFSVGWRKGAGEELSVFSHAQPRVLVPGDTLPFIGVLRDRHPDPRRHLISQWRALRRRMSPLRARPRPEPMLIDRNLDRPGSAGATLACTLEPRPGSSTDPPQQGPHGLQDIREQIQQRPKTASEENKRTEHRDISPLSLLREAKQRLRNKTVKDTPPAPREKSPSCVLREAKLRLRKLEIEAEAVERSYRDFRRRQTQLRQERTEFSANTTGNDVVKDLDGNRSKLMQKLGETYKEELTNHMPETTALNNDAEKYLREYQTKYDIGETHFRNKTATAQCVKPIPAGFSIIDKETDYLDTPLDEFRKFYTSDSRFERDRPHSTNSIKAMSSASNSSGHAVVTNREPAKDEKEQLEILKQNIGKIYNLPDDVALKESTTPELGNKFKNEVIEKDKNLLSVEVENVSEVKAKNEREQLGIKQNTDKMYNFPENVALKESTIMPELEKKINNEVIEPDKNLLRVEVESVSEVNNVQISESRTQDFLLVISSSRDTRDLAGSDPDMDEQKPEMTIIISPKQTSPKTDGDKTPRMKSESDHGPNDVIADIFNSDANNQISSVNLDIELSKELLEESISDVPKGDEYPDDFSADVDNYNSRSEYENNSPISLLKTSEDENFWDN